MQKLLEQLHNDIILKIVPAASGTPMQAIYVGGLLAAAGVILVWMSLIAMGWIYAERRVAGYIHARYGPNRVGPFGILQSLADGVKLLSKEDIIPTGANRFLYEFAPVLVFAGAFIPFVALPFSQHLVIADMDLGIFFVLAFGALEVVGILMAGWAPNSKWTLYGGMRLAAQMLSYEIPLGLSILTVVVLSGTLNLTDMVIWQSQGFLLWDHTHPFFNTVFGFLNWSIFRSPACFVAFFLFYVSALAECKRAPFDLPEAESELVSGFHTEYTGIRFSYFFLAEYCAMYVVSALGAVVFLGGWHWPFPAVYDAGSANIIANISAELTRTVHYEPLPANYAGTLALVPTILGNIWVFITTLLWHGPWATINATLLNGQAMRVIINEAFGFMNLVGKAFFLLFVMVWIRWTLPRFRIDQVMRVCLKVLLPFGLAMVLLASLQAVVSSPYKPYNLRAGATAKVVPPAPAPEGTGEGTGEATKDGKSVAPVKTEPNVEVPKADEPAKAAPAPEAAPAAADGPKKAVQFEKDSFDNN